MGTIDLRSDTVTLPTPAMREAMYKAELGDDVYGEDPTINRLQEMVAERMGMEAALLMCSGTMGNLVALLSHCQRGDEAIMGGDAHCFFYEAGGISVLGGVHTRTVPNLPNGMMDPDLVEDAIRTENIHFPITTAICMENTHNRCGGRVIPPAEMAQIKRIAERHGIAVHLDGARIYNAAVALGIDVKEIAAQTDSIQFCFSKGLSAPIGSCLVGSAAFIEQAHRNRKLVGGSLRQGGIIAAAAIVALETMVDRLAEDHENAKVLAEGLAEIPGLSLDPSVVDTNIMFVEVVKAGVGAQAVVDALAPEGVKVNASDARRFRAVTHYGIVRDDIDRALVAWRKAMATV